MLVDAPSERHTLTLKSLHFLCPNPLCLSCYTLSKRKILNAGLLGLKLYLSILHIFPQSVQIPLKFQLGSHFQADFSKLRAKLGQGLERNHVCLREVFQKTVSVSLDLQLSDTLQPLLVMSVKVNRRLAAGRRESLPVCKNAPSVALIGGLLDANDKLTNQIGDERLLATDD